MPPKKEQIFELPDVGITCKVQNSGLITVGIGTGGLRLTVFKRQNESKEQAAQRKLAEHRKAAGQHGSSSDPSKSSVISDTEAGGTPTASVLEPATQPMDVDDDDDRPGSPVAFGNLDAECELCEEEASAAFDLLSGGYCCARCVAAPQSPQHEQQIRE
eukprot:1538929-Prymnesium_polylepis.1